MSTSHWSRGALVGVALTCVACTSDLPAPSAPQRPGQPAGVDRVDVVGTPDLDAVDSDTSDLAGEVDGDDVIDIDMGDTLDVADAGDTVDAADASDVADTADAELDVTMPTIDEGPRGFGSETPGGAGGMLYTVTSTLDDGMPGTLRHALEAAGARTIEFDVAGPIVLTSPITITQGSVTLDGSTAASPVTLTGAQLRIDGATDIVMRHLRFRPVACGQRALEVLPGTHRLLVDHCSITWAGDEPVEISGIDPARPITDVTVQWSIIADSLDCDASTQGGFEIYGHVERASIHHNVLGIAGTLTPNLRARGPVEVVDNLIYDPGEPTLVGIQPMQNQTTSALDLLGNLYVRGPDSPQDVALLQVTDDDTTTVSLYLADNRVDGADVRTDLLNPADEVHVVTTPHVGSSQVAHLAPDTLEAELLARVGATLPCRVPIDADLLEAIEQRVAAIVATRTPAEVEDGSRCP